MPIRRCVSTSAILIAAGVVTHARPRLARADDVFEIEVFHAKVNDPGVFGAELHSNYVASGAARDAPELPPNHVLYQMLEPTFGLTKGWEIGAHLQAAVRPSGLDWGGAKLRTMLLIPVPETWPFRFGINFEGGYVPPSYDPGTWMFEVRPIAEWRIASFDIDLNPVVTFNFEGPSAGVPRFDPAAAMRYTLFATIDVGLEYYASFGPLSGFSPTEKQGHYVFETLDLVRWPAWIVRAGLGEGLTSASNPFTVTTKLGHLF